MKILSRYHLLLACQHCHEYYRSDSAGAVSSALHPALPEAPTPTIGHTAGFSHALMAEACCCREECQKKTSLLSKGISKKYFKQQPI
jgi:hypothetical protein